MKKTILSALLVAGMAATSFGQGLINASDSDNVNTSSSAATGGLYFINLGSGPVLLDPTAVGQTALGADALNIQLLGGPNSGSLAAVITITDGSFVSAGPGLYLDINGAESPVTGVALGGVATFRQNVWLGNFATYAAALSGGAYTATVTWTQNTGNGGTPAPSFLGMPATILATSVPEPTTLALAGLGAAALLIVRRRK